MDSQRWLRHRLHNQCTGDNCPGITGDDTFNAKAGDTNPLTHVLYSNNVGYSWKGTGTKVGVQSKRTASDIVFSNIQVVAGQRAVSVSHDEGAAAYSDLHFNDIRMENIEGTSKSGQFLVALIVIWTRSGGNGPVSNVSLSRITVENSGGFRSKLQGISSIAAISDVTLQDVSIDSITMNSSNYSSKLDVGPNVSGLNFGLLSGGIYTFVNQRTGQALESGNVTARNTPVNLRPVNLPETTSQQWKLTCVSGDTYPIVSQKSGEALENGNSRKPAVALLQSAATGDTRQQWAITCIADDLYKIISVKSGDAAEAGTTGPGAKSENTQLVQATPTGNATQQWKLTKQ